MDLAQQNSQSIIEADNLRPSPSPITPQYEGQLARDSYYYTGFWGAYKGYVKGLLGGLFIGGGLGGAVGLAGAGVLLAVSSLAAVSLPFTLPIAGAITAAGALWGMFKGAEEFAHIGSVAGTGVMLDEFELRNDRMQDALHRRTVRTVAAMLGKENELQAVMPEAYEPVKSLAKPWVSENDGPHMAAVTMPTTGLFHWKTAAIGLAVGLGVGALIVTAAAAAPAVASVAVLSGLLHGAAVTFGLAEGFATSGMVLASAYAGVMTMTGLFGGLFGGVDRSIFRKVMDSTDHWWSGELRASKHSAAANPLLTQHVSMPSPPIFAAASVAEAGAAYEAIHSQQEVLNSQARDASERVVDAVVAERLARTKQARDKLPESARPEFDRKSVEFWRNMTAESKAKREAAASSSSLG